MILWQLIGVTVTAHVSPKETRAVSFPVTILSDIKVIPSPKAN
jgi:hypothetical protein